MNYNMAATEKMKNAWDLLDLALKELKASEKEPVKIRDAAEKAWGATASAVEALIESTTGEEIEKGRERSRRLVNLEDNKIIPEEMNIVKRYYVREDILHGDCFYSGKCEPRDEIERRIIETKSLLTDIQKLIKRK